MEQPTQQGRTHRERWIGHDRERPPRQTEVARVNLYHRHRAPEAVAQRLRASGVQLDCDHVRATVDERRGERAEPRADVDHEIAAPHTGVDDESFSPVGSEQVGAPPWPGHGDAPS